MSKTFKDSLVVGILALVVVCAGTVAGDEVVVKGGTIGAGSVSPDTVKAFISDGPDDVTLEYGYGLLTVTSDPDPGTDNLYGTLCEYFPNAETSGYGKIGGGFFTRPVGTEADDRIYYGLYSGLSTMDGYSRNGKEVRMIGTGTSVTNPNHVAGGSLYNTTGLLVWVEPVENGMEMTGDPLNFKNYGIDVIAELDGDYQATSGIGENFGVRIKTVDALDANAKRPINSYALYLDPFTSNAKLLGGQTYGIYQEGSGVMNYFEGDISAAAVTDRTPGYDGTAQDALSEIVNTRSVDGEIDHSSLPVLARATLKRVEKTNRRIVEYTDPSGRIVEDEVYDLNIVEEEGRSLGGMITVLTEAVKGLNEKIEVLQAENLTLKAEIAGLKAQ